MVIVNPLMKSPCISPRRISSAKRRPVPRRDGRSALSGTIALLAVAILSCASTPRAHATTYYWDGDGSAPLNDATTGNGLGGTGTWDTASSKWWDPNNPNVDGLWGNAAYSIAVFIGTPGTVSLGSGLQTNGLSFFSNGFNLTGGTLTLVGTAPTIYVAPAQTATITSTIADSGAAGLYKSGLGTLVLNGVNTYTGPTTVGFGSLLVNGSTSATSAVAVGDPLNPGGGVLGGTGTIGGAVTVNGVGGISLANGSIGTLTLGNTLTATGTAGNNLFTFDMGSGGAGTDRINVVGSGTTGVVVTNAGAPVIVLNQIGGVAAPITSGTYNLISVTGASATMAAAARFSLATSRAFGELYSLQLDSATSKILQVVVTTGNPGPISGASFWSGTASNNQWNVSSSWKTDATSNTAGAIPGYLTNVTFYTTNPAPVLGNSTLNQDFDINSLTFSATATSGVNILAGVGKMLTIEAAAVNGNTAGNGITLKNSSGTQTITAPVGLASSQTWTVAAGATLGVNGVISDFGAGNGLTLAGGGTLTLTAPNTFSGGVILNSGKLIINNPTALGASAGVFTINGGTIDNTTGAFLGLQNDNPVTIGGSFAFSTTGGSSLNNLNLGLGAVSLNGSRTITLNPLNALNPATLTFGGVVTNTTNGTITTTVNGPGNTLAIGSFALNSGAASVVDIFNGNGNITMNGPVSNGGSAANGLTYSGTGTLTLLGANNYTGATTVSSGALIVNGSIGASSAVNISGGVLAGTGTINGPVTLSGTGGINLPLGTAGTGTGIMTLGGNLSITGAAGANKLAFDLGAGTSQTDEIIVAGVTSVTNSAAISFNQIGQAQGSRVNAGTYTLIAASNTLNLSNYTLITHTAFGSTFSLGLDGTLKQLQVTVTSSAPGPSVAYWAGSAGNNWSTATNWRTDATSNINTSGAPAYNSDVFFNTVTPTALNLTNTVLGADSDINSLTFSSAASTGVTIGGNNTLTIEATLTALNAANSGIIVNAPVSPITGVTTHTISANVALAESQTWTVNQGTALAVTGSVTDYGAGYTLTKAGDGTLKLFGATIPTLVTAVKAGALIISTTGASANDTSTFNITGSTVRTSNGSSNGGVLVLENTTGTASPTPFAGTITLSGFGPNFIGTSNPGGTLVSVRNNTLSGLVSTNDNVTLPNVNTGIVSANGLLTFSGSLAIGRGTQTFFGAYNSSSGVGNYAITGSLLDSGNATIPIPGILVKMGPGTLTLNPSNSSGYSGTIRVSGGTVRILSGTALGSDTNTGAVAGTASAVLDMNGGALEALSDSGAINANVYGRANSTFFVDHALVSTLSVGTAINGTTTFGQFTFAAGTTLTLTGRDGYGVTFMPGSNPATLSALIDPASQANNSAFTNNLNGLLTLTGDIWGQTNTTSRTMTISGSGDTLITGYILATGSDHFLTKSGQGTLTLNASNPTAASSTYTGGTNISGGTLAVTNIKTLLNQNSVTTTGANNAINLNGGSLSYLGTLSTGAGETSPTVINLSGTTGAGIILANQAGSVPTALTLSSGVSAGGAGVKTLFLGGAASSNLINTVSGVIQNNSSTNLTSLTKVGTDTWLYSPSAASYGTGAYGVNVQTTVTGLGAPQSNTITVASASNIRTGQVVTTGGTGVPVAAVVTNINGTTITLSSNIGAQIASGTSITFGAITNFTGSVTVGGGLLQVKPTAASGTSGGNLFTTAQNLIFNTDALTTNGSAGGTFELVTPAVTMTGNLLQTMGALQLSAGAGKLQVDAGNGGFSNILTFNAYTTRTAGAVVDFAPAASLAGIQFSVVPTAVSSGVLSGSYFTSSTGAIDFVATPAANTPVAALGSTTALPLTGALGTANYRVNANTTTTGADVANTIRIISGANLTLGANLTITSTNANNLGGILHDNAGGASKISSTSTATISTVTANQELLITTGGINSNLANVLQTPSTALLTISSVLANGSGGVTKAGNGLLVLSGQNTFTGALTIDEGGLRASGTNTQTLGAPAATTVDILRQGASLDVFGAGASTSPYTGGTSLPTLIAAPISGAGSITSTASGSQAIQLGTSASTGSGVFSGIISDGSGTMTVIRNGAAGTEVLTGLNTYTGPTVLSGGAILQANVLANGSTASSIGASSNAAGNLVLNGGTLLYQGENATVYSPTQTPSVSTDRLFTLTANGGVIDSSGTYGNQQVGTTTPNNAALVFSNSGQVAFSASGISPTLTLQGSSTGDNQFNPWLTNPASGILSINKTGVGVWVLNNIQNNYTGPTTINAGVLRAFTDATQATGVTLPVTSNLTFNGGVLESTGNFSRTLGTLAGNVQWKATLTGNGSGGFAAASSNLTVTFGGSPVWGAAPFLDTGSLILNSTTAMAEVQIVSGFGINSGATAALTATTANGSATVNLTGVSTTAGLTIGQVVTSPFLPNGTTFTIAAINSTTQFTLSTGTGVSAGTNISVSVAAGGVRQIIVNDNPNTNTDLATITGSISGTGSLSKAGAGVLQLFGANTYTGSTAVTAGTLVANTLGLSTASATGTSVGSNVGGNTLTQALTLGNGTTGAAILQYVGTGETSDRLIQVNTTTGSDQIYADGTGPLVLTNVVNNTSLVGARTLFLRGSNTQPNVLGLPGATTSSPVGLADGSGTSPLSITIDGSATWVLAGNNTFTGSVTPNYAPLGLGSSAALRDGKLVLGGSLQSVFAYGGDHILYSDNPAVTQIQLGGNTYFAGNYSLSFLGTLALTGSVSSANNIISGKTLTFSSVTETPPTGAVTWTINGSGNTAVTGVIADNPGATLNLVFNPPSSSNTLTLSGASTYKGTTQLLNATTILNGSGGLSPNTALTLGNATTSATLQLGDSSGPVNVTIGSLAGGSAGANQIINGNTLNAVASTLTLNTAVNTTLDPNVSVGISPSVSGLLTDPRNNIALVKTGTNATLTVANPTYYTGGTFVGTPNGPDGGTLALVSAGTLGIGQISPGPVTVYAGTLKLDDPLNPPGTQYITNLTVGGGGSGTTANVIVGTTLTLGDYTHPGNIIYDATNNPNPATISAGTYGGALNLNPNGTTITVGSSTAGSGAGLPDLTISVGLVDQGGPLIKAGLGTLQIISNSATSFNQPVFVNAGSLILNGSSGTPVFGPGVPVTVGTATNGATLDLGGSGYTTFNNLSLYSNSHLVFNLGPNNVNYDQLGAPGNPISIILNPAGPLSTGLKVDLKALAGFGTGTPSGVNFQYILLDEIGTDLSVRPFSLGSTPGGFGFNLQTLQIGAPSNNEWQLLLTLSPATTDFYWKGGASVNWNNGGNWSNSNGSPVLNAVPSSVNNVYFATSSGPANQSNTIVDVSISVNNLTISDPVVVTIKGVNGTLLTIYGDLLIDTTAGTSGPVTFGSATAGSALSLGVASNQETWTNNAKNGSGSLIILGSVSSQGTSGTQILTFAGASHTTLAGSINDGGLGGQLELIKTDAGTLSLTNASNTYTGGTKIQQGMLEFASASTSSALGTGKIAFTGDATLRWLSATGGDISSQLVITDTGSSLFHYTATLDTNGKNVTFATPLQNGSPTNGALTVTGAGTLFLNAVNNFTAGYTGGTNISVATLEFAHLGIPTTGSLTFTAGSLVGSSVLQWGPGNTDDISSLYNVQIANNVIATLDTNNNNVILLNPILSTTGALAKTGNGTLSLYNAGTPGTYPGGTFINGGTLEFLTGALPTAGGVTFTGNSTLRWATNFSNPTNGDDVSSIAGGLVIQSSVVATLDTNGNNVTFASPITNSGTLNKINAGTLTLGADNSANYTGLTLLAGGTVEFVPNGLGSLTAAARTITFTGNSTLRWGTADSTVVTNPFNTDDLSSRLNIANSSAITATLDTNGNNVNFANPINGAVGASTGNLFKTGAGTLTMQASSPNFQGAVTVDSGTLAVSGSLSGTTAVNVALGATLQFSGGANSIKSTAAVVMGIPSSTSSTAAATLLTNNTNQQMGVFTLSGNAVIDFNLSGHTGAVSLKFADSSAVSSSWNGTLSIDNWVSNGDHLFFGNGTGTGLTQAQLNMITFYSDGGSSSLGTATFAAGGEVVPVPEPAGLLTLLGGAGLLLGLRRRQQVNRV